MRLLILDDDRKDILLADDAARSAGFEDIEAFTSLATAVQEIEEALRGEKPLPDAIILDLDFGSESGYDLLRQWRAKLMNPKIPIIVWSQLGGQNREICALFEVSTFVGKWEGKDALREALEHLNLAAGRLDPGPSEA